jgi:phosphate/sulfate permease
MRKANLKLKNKTGTPARLIAILAGFAFVGVLLMWDKAAEMFADVYNNLVKPVVPVTAQEVQQVAQSLTAVAVGSFVAILGTFIGVPVVSAVVIVVGLIFVVKGGMALYNYFADKNLN